MERNNQRKQKIENGRINLQFKNGSLHISLPLKFKTPEDLEKYVQTKKEDKKFMRYIERELGLIEKWLNEKSRNKEFLWDRLLSLVVQSWSRCYGFYKDKIMELGKQILNKEDINEVSKMWER